MTTTNHPPVPPGAEPLEPGETPPTLGLHFDPRHFGIDPRDPWPDDVPRGQDDSHWRYENDPRGARRAEMRIAFCWTLTVLASIGLMAVYVAGGQTQVEGACWAVAFL